MGDARAARELIGELLWDWASPLLAAPMLVGLPPLVFLDDRLEPEGEELLLFWPVA